MNPITQVMLLCPCCGTGTPDLLLLAGLHSLQAIIVEPLIITSACRCPKENTHVKGALHSLHLTGQAADIRTQYHTPLQLYLAAEQIPAFRDGGIGLYPLPYIHLDVRGHRARYYRVNGLDFPITEYLTTSAHLP